MTPLMQWAARWNISTAAINELRLFILGLDGGPGNPTEGASETAVQTRVRVHASRRGMRLWRNNVGVFHDPERNIYVRYGLANDSRQMNEVVKSADLIGIDPVVITPAHVGHTIGQFVSFECKHEGWKYTGTDRERAQENWAQIVTSLGGRARFITSEAQL